jgi:hypothetical protein
MDGEYALGGAISPALEQRHRLTLMAEAAELGPALDQHHNVESSSQACGVCGFRVYEPVNSLWWHLPAVEDLERVRSWLGGSHHDGGEFTR